MNLRIAHLNHRRGAGVIGLLMALVIMAILTVMYLNHRPAGDSGTGAPSPSRIRGDLDKSKAVACQANRATAQHQITSWRMANPGRAPSVEALRASGVSLPPCPAGGELSVGPEGQIFCSIHHPDPDAASPGETNDEPFPPPSRP